MSEAFVDLAISGAFASPIVYLLYRTIREERWFDVALGMVWLASTLALVFVPHVRESSRILAFDLWLRALPYSALLGTLLALAASGVVQKRKWRLFYPLVWALCFSPVAAFLLLRQVFASHPEEMRVHPDGDTYAVMSGRFPLGSRRLAKQVERRWYGREFEELSSTPSSCAGLQLVRVQGQDDTLSRRLHFAPDGRVVVIEEGNWCALVYEGAGTLSPFLLLDERAEPSQRDVTALLATIDRGDAEERPSTTALRLGAMHPNPRVREVARRLLERMRQFPPKKAASDIGRF